MDFELSGRVALVTGASAGIGRGIAEVLATEGVQLIVAARREHLLRDVAARLVAAGSRPPLVVPLDLTLPQAVEEIRWHVLDRFGRLDILVNNAGGGRPVTADAPDEEWKTAFDLNFDAYRRLAHAFLPVMQRQQWGRIVNITGSSEPQNLNAGNVAKAAVHAWAKGLTREVSRFGITVNSVCPGRIMSEQITGRLLPTAEDREEFAGAHIPVGYIGEPQDIGYAVAFLASPKARYITGEIVHVDGGMRRHAF
ncbi:MAG: SDR family oxidoreductase [Chloroflexi bacterium]|nr:SDR family oxidoreductase [Chloroflexota bacterium]MBI4506516.1 SDR family oxidoreductase [Chloroflexota bacterium]